MKSKKKTINLSDKHYKFITEIKKAAHSTNPQVLQIMIDYATKHFEECFWMWKIQKPEVESEADD